MPTLGITALATGLLTLSMMPDVRADGCPQLSASDVSAHLAVEHPEFADGTSPTVSLTCDADVVTVVVDDPAVNQRLERQVEVSQNDPDRNRQVALATSSLIIAGRSSADENLSPPPANAQAPTEQAQISPRADPVGSIQVTASGRLRDLPRALPTLHGSVRAGWLPSRALEVFGQVDLEYGQARRHRGRVNVSAVVAGPGVAWTFRADRRLGIQTSAAVLVGYTRLVGRTARGDVQPGSLGGPTAELAVDVGPRIVVGRFVLTLALQTGYTLPTVRGNVTGEPDVHLGGVWAGAGLRLGALLGRRT